MLKSIFEAAGLKTGVMGTTGIIFGDTHIHSDNSTPESYLIHKYMRQMVDSGCKAMVIEASSQGFMMHRTHGIMFDAGIFTNISPDHIGPTEHETFEEYLSYKKMLFAQSKVSVLNRETDCFDDIIKSAENALTFSDKSTADFSADNVRFYAEEASLSTEFVCKARNESFGIKLHIPGEFSISNALAAISASYSLGIKKEAIIKGLYDVFVPGRMELVPSQSKATVIIDYAHNELSVTGLFKALETYAPKRILTVFGCGGNRSKLRRYAMGEIIARKSDIAVITSDKPRYEALSDIAEDIFTGMNRVTDGAERIIIDDRKEAIKKALSIGAPGDVILVIGKGHQHYEEINGVKYPFNEREIISEFVGK
jgi:UDP-N-acetylmuramoyl-L-alanyl-D-glutamate--2,6-diaminopimelate ligase